MPVLEAMATGLPVVVTAGGPTDEFCPAEAGWRIPSVRAVMPGRSVGALPTVAEPWVLEPNGEALVELLLQVDAAGRDELARRGRLGRSAASKLSWDAVASMYAERLRALASRAPRTAVARGADVPFEWAAPAGARVLATPAWRGADRLAELLAAWAAAAPSGTDACLELLADPRVDGDAASIEAHVLTAAAAAGVDLEGCADIDLVLSPGTAERDVRIARDVAVFVPLHDACAGWSRTVVASGGVVASPTASSLRAALSGHAPAPAGATTAQ
jgi:hypothetical protein